MLKKYAVTLVKTSAVQVPEGASRTLRRTIAKRHHFDFTPRAGYLYVRSRAISSRTNDNYDEFPAEEIKEAYKTFEGKPVFVNHVNDNHRRARGIILESVLHEDRLADGHPDTWAEVLMEIDAKSFPKLAQAILEGRIDRTSMGCDVAYSICSACGNRATTPAEYCQHIPRLKGKKISRRNPETNKVETHLIRETCYGLKFFENSVLVEEPADPTAYFTGIEDYTKGDMAKAAMKRVVRDDGTAVWTTETKDTDPLSTSECNSKRDNPTFCNWHKTDHLETNGEPRTDIDGHGKPMSSHSLEVPQCDLCDGFHDSLHHDSETEGGQHHHEDESALDGIPLDDPEAGKDTGPAGGAMLGGPGYRYVNSWDRERWDQKHSLLAHFDEDDEDEYDDSGEAENLGNYHHCPRCGQYADRTTGYHPGEVDDDNPEGRCSMPTHEERVDKIYDSLHPADYCHDNCRDGHANDLARGVGVHHTFNADEGQDGSISAGPHSEPVSRQSGEYEVRKPGDQGLCHYCRRPLVDTGMTSLGLLTRHFAVVGSMDSGNKRAVLHRGMAITLSPEDTERFASATPAEKARMFIGRVGDEHQQSYTGRLGSSWSRDEGVAGSFAHSGVSDYAESTDGLDFEGHPGGAYHFTDEDAKGWSAHPVILHADHPGSEHVMTPDEAARVTHGESEPYESDHQEAEEPIRPGTQMRINGVSWHDGKGWQRHDVGIHRTAKKDDGPSVSGVALKAKDTGRMLMLQRSFKDGKDPARGTWEFPGGHHEDGDQSSLHAGIREWEEEIGQPFPSGGTVSHVWRSPNGVYQGHVVVIPKEEQVALHEGRVLTNPDDPDGDDSEQAAWWDPKHAQDNPALRSELKKAPWDEIRKAAGIFTRNRTSEPSADNGETVCSQHNPDGCGHAMSRHFVSNGQVQCGKCSCSQTVPKYSSVQAAYLDMPNRDRPAPRPIDASTLWPVKVVTRDRTTGEPTGHFAAKGDGDDTLTMCSRHLTQLRGEVMDHNTKNLDHPHTAEVQAGFTPLDSGQCHSCAAEGQHTAKKHHHKSHHHHKHPASHPMYMPNRGWLPGWGGMGLFGGRNGYCCPNDSCAGVDTLEGAGDGGVGDGGSVGGGGDGGGAEASKTAADFEGPDWELNDKNVQHLMNMYDRDRKRIIDTTDPGAMVMHMRTTHGLSGKRSDYPDNHPALHAPDHPERDRMGSLTMGERERLHDWDHEHGDIPGTNVEHLHYHELPDDPREASLKVSSVFKQGHETCPECGGPKDHMHIQVSPEMRDLMGHIHDQSQFASEMHDHGQKRVVDTDNYEDVKQHLIEAHGYDEDDFHRNSHDDNHPALDDASGGLDDRPLHDREVGRLHDWEHGHGMPNEHPDYDGGVPGHFWESQHFHTAVRKQASWIGDHFDEPTLFWRAPKSKKWEVHVHNYTPDRDLREGYDAKPHQYVSVLHTDNKVEPHPDNAGRVDLANRGAWEVHRDPQTLGLSYKPNTWGGTPHGEHRVPEHVENQIHNALNEVARHVEDHANLYGGLAQQDDIRSDQSKAERDHRDEGRGQQMFRNLLNAAGESTCPKCDGEGNTEHGPKTCIACDGTGFLKHGSLRKQADEDQCPHCGDDGGPIIGHDPLLKRDIYACQGCGKAFVGLGGDDEIALRDSKHFLGLPTLERMAAQGLVRHEVPASEVTEGDYLDIGGKIRVHQTMTRGDRTTLAWRLRGSKAPGIRHHDADETVKVWRREGPVVDTTEHVGMLSQHFASDYMMRHRPVGESPVHDLPEDLIVHPEYHGLRSPGPVSRYHCEIEHAYAKRSFKAGLESHRQMQAAQGKPDHPVTVYRAVPKEVDHINTGDWVSLSPTYAQMHGDSNLDPDYKILKHTAPAKHVAWDDGTMDEFGYHGPSVKAEEHTDRLPELPFHDDGDIQHYSAKEPEKTGGDFLHAESTDRDYWGKPKGTTDYDPMMVHHGFQPKEEGHGPWTVVRHPETRAYHVLDNQGRSAYQSGPTVGHPKYEMYDHNAESDAFNVATMANQDHGHIPKWRTPETKTNPHQRAEVNSDVEETGLNFRDHFGRGLRLPGTENARRKGEPMEDASPIDTQHLPFHYPPPPVEHTTEDPRVTEYKQRAKDNPAPEVYPAKTVQQSSSREHGTTYRQIQHGDPAYDSQGAFHDPSPDDEWHGPYQVIKHPETGKFHVVDNQNRVTRVGGREGMDEQHHAERMRDYIDGRMQSKEKGRAMGEAIFNSTMETLDPGGTSESRASEHRTNSLSDLMHRYEGGDHHPLHPGKFGYDHDEDDEGSPYYEIKDPSGSGWKARDYSGGHVSIHHEATGDEPHDDIHLPEDHAGYGHDELHTELHHWAHGDPNPDPRYPDDIDPDTGRGHAPGHDYARNDPRIERWQKRNGYKG